MSECLFGLESPRSRGLPPPWSLPRLGVPRPKNHTHMFAECGAAICRGGRGSGLPPGKGGDETRRLEGVHGHRPWRTHPPLTRVRSRPLPPGDVGSLTHAGRVQRPAPTGSSFPTRLKRALALGAPRVPGAWSRPERPRALLGRRATPRRPPDTWAGFSPGGDALEESIYSALRRPHFEWSREAYI